MVLNLNAHYKSGDHQTGKGQRVTLVLAGNLHGADATGVNLTRAELVSEGYLPSATLAAGNPIEINGVTYTVDATYDAALAAQQNVDTIFKAFAAKANVVYMDVRLVTAGWYAAPFADADDVEIEIVFEQKGFLGTAAKGEVSLGDAADNYGDSQADVAALMDTLTLQSPLLADVALNGLEGTNFGAAVKVSANLQS